MEVLRMRELVLGTRNSKLALIQAENVVNQLKQAGVKNPIKIKEVLTKGDKRLDVSLPNLGGSGVFLEELEKELLEGTIDFAVHSLKDIPAVLPEGLHIASIPEREDHRDAYLANDHVKFNDLPSDAVIGTSSLRRAAQLLKLRSDIKTEWIRGPIDSRIEQMHSGNYDAIILAVAGIKRLGIGTNLITEYLPAETFVPAPGQGALAIECRKDDEELNELLLKINNPKSEQTTLAERAFLAYFDEGESAPIGGFAEVDGDNILFHGMVISRDGTRVIEHIEKDSDPVKAANKTAELLIDQGAYDIIRGA